MKKFLTLIILLTSVTLLSAFTYKTIRSFTTPVLNLEPQPITTIEINIPEVEIDFDSRGHMAFLTAIGHQESGNRYNIVNRFGYMGKYQFGKSTLRTLKIKVSKEAFLSSPDLQEYAMQQLLLYNKKRLQKYINNWKKY